MIKLSKKQNGFTIIELLIVIIVIGILAAIVISTYSGIQVKQRNSKRQTDVQALQTQLEAFYSQNGYYPSLTDINTVTWRDKNMTNLNAGDMVDPSAKDQNSADAKLASTPAIDTYSYQVTDSNGNSCESKDTNCAKYTLTASFEGTVNGQKTYIKQNLD
ncbi:MAG: prepilin-type N-terminal cleavage/methylation domain-containing protein [Candidatus Saccharibacteria bacterium]